MLTPILEKLVLSGGAQIKTFVAGGSQKHILNVPDQSFIIITDITYFSEFSNATPYLNNNLFINDYLRFRANTQIKIFSEKSYNVFAFRNDLNICSIGNPLDGDIFVTPVGSTHHNVYLIHESDVSFSFSYFGDKSNVVTGVTDPKSIAFAPAVDYGKDGQVGALPVRLVSEGPAGPRQMIHGGQLYARPGDPGSLQLEFGVDATSDHFFVDGAMNMPILQVQYILIPGTPANLSGSM